MINYNGTLIAYNQLPVEDVKRATFYGDALFETIRMRDNKLLFIEDHYFRLMSSMRILHVYTHGIHPGVFRRSSQ